MGTFTFPLGPVEIDPSVAQAYPVNTLLWPISRNRAVFRWDGFCYPRQQLEVKMKAEAKSWLLA